MLTPTSPIMATFPKDEHSLLSHEDLPIFDLANDPEPFLARAKAIRRDKQGVPEAKYVTVYYDAEIFADDKEALEAAQYTRNAKRVLKHRERTKHRIVHLSGTFYGDAHGKEYKPGFEASVIIACAPNAMGSSDSDVAAYFKPFRRELYKQVLKLTYLRTMHAAREAGNTVFVVPPFGMGLYLRHCSESDRTEAMRANYEALCEAIKAYPAFEEVFCVMPDDNRRSRRGDPNPYLPIAQRVFADYDGKTRVTLGKSDAMATTAVLRALGKKVALLIAGSDATFGGSWEADIEDHFPPAEEMAAWMGDWVQSAARNFDSRSQYINTPFPPDLSAATLLDIMIHEAEVDAHNPLKTVREDKNGSGTYIVKFDTKEKAEKFAEYLLSMDISRVSDPGKIKQVFVHPTEHYASIALTPEQLRKYLYNTVLSDPAGVERALQKREAAIGGHKHQRLFRPHPPAVPPPLVVPPDALKALQEIDEGKPNEIIENVHRGKSQGNYRVVFAKKEDADKFSQYIAKKFEVKSKKGEVKAVHADRGKFYLVLTVAQLTTLSADKPKKCTIM